MSVSQPLRLSPSQSAQPGSQLGTQAPPEQLVVPWSLAHPRLQPPQCVVDPVLMSCSQPLSGSPSQSR